MNGKIFVGPKKHIYVLVSGRYPPSAAAGMAFAQLEVFLSQPISFCSLDP